MTLANMHVILSSFSQQCWRLLDQRKLEVVDVCNCYFRDAKNKKFLHTFYSNRLIVRMKSVHSNCDERCWNLTYCVA